ncbi:MAG: quinate 5-dehydrogenase [bacterium]
MKKVLSISLGSSQRDHQVKTTILGKKFFIARRGTDGDKKKASQLFSEMADEFDVLGIGGMDLFVYAGNKRYQLRETKNIIQGAGKTPVVDGSGLKNTLERKVLYYLSENKILDFQKRKVLIVSAVDRFGMAETLKELGADLRVGDLLFILGLPLVFKSLGPLELIARIIAPVVVKLPLDLLYPTGEKQEKEKSAPRYIKHFREAEVICGDFHLIKRFSPPDLKDKIIITNTVTGKDVARLEKKGLKTLITTTPNLGGRSFGTNVMEAVLVALAEPDSVPLNEQLYLKLLKEINFTPRIENLN